MKVSIVLPNINGAGWLAGCIDSLYAQTLQDFELIIVDNGSTDESLQTARALQGRANYTLIENGRNTGFSYAVNQGIKLAKAPYVMLFNNDAFARPDMLEKLVAKMEAEPRAFAVQSLMLQHKNPALADDAGDYVTLFGWAMKRGDGMPAVKYQRDQRIFSACGGASLYRKSILDEIGLFDEHFFAYFEDVDLSWRANCLGYKNYLCADAVCTHICGASTGAVRYNDFKAVQSGRNSLLLPYKNMPLGMLVLNLPFVLGGYLLKTAVFYIRGYAKPWNTGLKEGLKLIGRLDKPKFHLKNLPSYLWVEGSLFVGCFRFIDYRLRRLFGK